MDHPQLIYTITFRAPHRSTTDGPPDRFGSREGVRDRLRRWAAGGTCEERSAVHRPRADAEGFRGRDAAADSTVVRAHQHVAGAARRGSGSDVLQILPGVHIAPPEA
ncbi:hypothetical protein [Streptomyces sp. NBC_00046]|uniref:hypothetical protein n=1 Tax=unclassified Streptomyces TaxID=2593676 RepID=UPI0032514BF2